jgi:oligopeptide/dipeptide ABC transporter ATP-binding protein
VDNLIEVKDLEVRFDLKEGTVRAVNGVSLNVGRDRSLGIVGESGCGKSITAKAMMRILPSRAKIVRGTIRLAPRNGGAKPIDLTGYRPNAKALRAIRGADISMIFQEPMTSLSPVHTIGNQIVETVLLHQNVGKKEARDRAVEMLRLVGVPLPERRVDAYPHQLSGGLRQRSMIAMALACNPRLLIADEPTTALDVTIQAQILALIARLREELGMSVIMITHDLGVVAETTDEVAVMYLGLVVERGPVKEIFRNPKHPYTVALLESIPRIGKGNKERLASITGSVPDSFTTPPGCPFHPRCGHAANGQCDIGAPPGIRRVGERHTVACHLYNESGPVSEEPVSQEKP